MTSGGLPCPAPSPVTSTVSLGPLPEAAWAAERADAREATRPSTAGSISGVRARQLGRSDFMLAYLPSLRQALLRPWALLYYLSVHSTVASRRGETDWLWDAPTPLPLRLVLAR